MADNARSAPRPEWDDERRGAARAPVELEVDLYHARGIERACRTQNLTAHGLFIEGHDATVGEAVEVCVALPYLPGRWRVAGRVVYAGVEGVGVRFRSLSAPVRRSLGLILGDVGGVDAVDGVDRGE